MSDKLKIACISTDPGVAVNGWKKDNSIQIQQSVAALTSAGCEVHLFAANVEFSLAPELSDAIVHPLAGRSKRRGCPSHRKVSAISNQYLKATLNEHEPFDLVYEWFSLYSAVGMQYADDHGIAGILHLDTDIIRKLKRYSRLVSEVAVRKFATRCFDNATALIADSHDVARYLEAFNVGSGKTHIVPGGIRVANHEPQVERACEQTGTFTVGYVGNLDRTHPLDDLICSFDRMHQEQPRSRLLIVGGGSGQQAAEDLINARGLSDVTTLTGRLADNEVRALKRHMDAIVVPAASSSAESPSTTSLLENMASGAVIVAAESEHTGYAIEDGVNGILYEKGDHSGLAETLNKLHSYPEFARSLSEKAQKFVSQHHSPGNTCQKILEITHQDALRQAAGQSSAMLPGAA